MNSTKLIIGTVVGAVVVFLLDWVFYGMLMTDLFTKVAGYHSDMPNMMWMIIGDIILMGVFAYMYAKGVDKSGTAMQQGMRFGVLVGLLLGVGLNLIWYSLQMADPLSDFLIDGAYTIVKFSVAGIAVAMATGIPGAADGDRGKGDGGGGEV